MKSIESINFWLKTFGLDSDRNITVPSAFVIWQQGNKRFQQGKVEESIKYEHLNLLLHSSSIPSSCKLGKNVRFARGGMGVVLHQNCIIGNGVVIGTHVTVGGKTGAEGSETTAEGARINLPIIDDYAYIATCSKIFGPVKIGKLSIIAANSVIISDVEPLAVVAGSPAKVIGHITPENCLKYKNTFYTLRGMPESEYIQLVKSLAR